MKILVGCRIPILPVLFCDSRHAASIVLGSPILSKDHQIGILLVSKTRHPDKRSGVAASAISWNESMMPAWHPNEEIVVKTVLSLVAVTGVLVTPVAFGVLWYQALYWLRVGEWRPLALGEYGSG